MERKTRKERRRYVDSCSTYEVLLQDSGLAPKPRENWNTFEPKEGDWARVDNDGDYCFDGEKWVKEEKTEEMGAPGGVMG